VVLDRCVQAQPEVGRGADAQRDLSIGQQAHQFGILDRSHAMVDAVGAQKFDGVSHTFRPARLTGMHGAAQSDRARPPERLGEPRPRAAGRGFVAVD